MPLYELVLWREGKEDELVSMGADNLHSGLEFTREGVDWLITADDGPPRVFTEEHVARLICEPKEN